MVSANHDDGAGRPVCDRCYALPFLWFSNRPDCAAFSKVVQKARAEDQKWGISDLRVRGRTP